VLRFVFRFTFALAFAIVAVANIAGQSGPADVVVRAASYVARYYERAQSLLATEVVIISPLERGMDHEGYVWRMTNEVRFEPGSAAAPPRITRRLLVAQPPALGPPFQNDCLEPTSFSVDPLVLLLPANRPKFRFSTGRMENLGGIRTQRVDFRPLTREPADVYWHGRCGIIRSVGSTRGQFWVDPANGDVLRYQDELPDSINVPGPPDKGAPRSFTLQRFDTTVDYKRFAFTEPEETLLLPARVETVSAVHGTAVPRVRIVRTFSEYRRFLGSARIIE
jgi:hypothetical protein